MVYTLLNRRDLFVFPAQSNVLTALQIQNQARDVGIWNMLWQIILGKELARRLEQGSDWSMMGLTKQVLSTVIIADLWLGNVRIVKADARKEMQRKFPKSTKYWAAAER